VGISLEKMAHPPSKESYLLPVKFIVSELILNGNKPENLISQGEHEHKNEEKGWVYSSVHS
jgi:hypothetical protein